MSNKMKTILIVDDSIKNIQLLTDYLSSLNHHLIEAQNGATALKVLESKVPDLIVLSTALPDVDAFEFAGKIGAKEGLKTVPIVFLSSANTDAEKLKAFKSGVDYIAKPFMKEELLARVNTHLSINTLKKSLNWVKDTLDKTSKMVRIGCWDFDVVHNSLNWSLVTKEIYEVDQDYIPDFETAISFYLGRANQNTMERLLENAIKNGESYDVELQITTAKGNERWVKAMGRADFINGSATCIYGSIQDISERKLAEEKMHGINFRFQQAFEVANIAICQVDTNGRLIMANDQACRLFGYTRKELMGKPFNDVTHPDDIGKSIKVYEEALSGKITQHRFTKRYIHKDGHVIWAEVSSILVKDTRDEPQYFFSYLLDITGLKEAEKTLNQYKNIVSSSQDMLALVDSDFTYLAANDAYLAAFNADRDDFIGKKVPEFQGDDVFKNIIKPYALKCMRGERTRYLEWFNFPGTGKRFMEMNYDPYRDEKGKIKGYVVDARDMAKHKEIEDKLKESEEQFTKNLEIKVKERTKELVKTQRDLAISLRKEKILGELKSQFVATASHQFRTPLTVIQSNMGILSMQTKNMDADLSQKFTIAYNRIKGQIERMTILMDEVLILGKINAGSVKPVFASVDLVELCEGVVANHNEIEEGKRNIELSLKGVPEVIPLDAKLMEHALSNIVSNALKYSVHVNPPTLTIDFGKKKVSIAVKDQGIGIPAADLKHLFEPFFRASNVGEVSGTGLGSAIAKEYIELNGGTLEVNSKLGKGSEFIIEFTK